MFYKHLWFSLSFILKLVEIYEKVLCFDLCLIDWSLVALKHTMFKSLCESYQSKPKEFEICFSNEETLNSGNTTTNVEKSEV